MKINRHSVTVTFVDLISPATGTPVKLNRKLTGKLGKAAAIKTITMVAKRLYREAFGDDYEGAIRVDYEALR